MSVYVYTAYTTRRRPHLENNNIGYLPLANGRERCKTGAKKKEIGIGKVKRKAGDETGRDGENKEKEIRVVKEMGGDQEGKEMFPGRFLWAQRRSCISRERAEESYGKGTK